MRHAHLFASILLLTVVSFAQQPSGTVNPQDRTTNPNDQSYTRPATPTDQSYNRPTDQTYSRPVETGHNWGGWGLLGLLGLGGLLGRRRETTTGTTYTRDERTFGEEPRRRAG